MTAFLPLERELRARADRSRAAAEASLHELRADIEREEAEATARLERAVLEAESEAVRDVEMAARDRVSAARSALAAWVADEERRLEYGLAELLRRLLGESRA